MSQFVAVVTEVMEAELRTCLRKSIRNKTSFLKVFLSFWRLLDACVTFQTPFIVLENENSIH